MDVLWRADGRRVQELNVHYVVDIEVFLAKAFGEGINEDDEDLL